MKLVNYLALAFILLATAAFPATTEIALSSADAAFLGERADDMAGHHVSIIGDINNDSYDDFIITAPGWDQNENSQNNGAAYLFYGKPAGFSGTIDLAAADAIFIGNTGQEAAHDAFGIGDVDDDGYNDFAIGLKKYHAVVDDTLRNKVGKVYIFFGGPKYVGAIALESAEASFEGTNAYAEAAHVKGVGDVNNDNYDDIIVGAGFHSQVGPEAGKVYLFFGKARGEWLQNAKMEEAADASFLAESEYDWAGHRVSNVGDVNDDGLMDFIVAANYNDFNDLVKSGKVYLILGKETGWALDTPLNQAADASWVGHISKLGLGWNVGNPGDVDGDGLNDIILGGNKYETFVLLGKNINYSANQFINTAADVTLNPPESLSDDIGHDMHTLGDMNGDNIDDFIIGGSNLTDDVLGEQAGKAFVFYGRSSWPSQLNFEDADIIFTAENGGDAAGFSVSGNGDVNNDGQNDILISASHYDNSAGKIYLFQSTNASLTLTHPNGGEIFSAGSTTQITWTPDPDVDQVTLELSTDNGSSWDLVAENINDFGSYEWTVPTVNSENCLIRIKDAFDGAPQDQSNGVFTITNEATITVIAPNGGEHFTVGNSVNIQWSSFNLNEHVKIELSVDDGITWDAITVDTDNDGSYTWTVPDRPTTVGRIRVTGSPTYSVQDASDAAFTISGSNFVYYRIEAEDAKLSAGYIAEDRPETSNGQVARLQSLTYGTVIYKFNIPPAEYELFVRYLDEIDGVSTSVININGNKVAEWQWDKAEQSDVFLYRSFGTFSFEKNDNVEMWTLRDNGEYARVDYFEFVRLDEPIHSLTVLSPNGGEEWQIDTSQEIVWTAENTSGFYNIQMTRDAGATWETLVNNIGITPAADGTMRVKVPVTGPASDSCLVKIVDVDGAPVDQSDDFFSIVEPPEPTITVTSPNGSEQWIIDSVVTITWESENTSGDVKIELSRTNGTSWQTLTESTDDDGDFEWQVVGPPAETCLIRINDIDKPVSDVSDAAFAIKGTPKIVLTAPNGGESWEIGTTQKIRWTSEYIDGKVKIDVSRDNGAAWSVVAEDVTNTGSYDWLVKGPATSTALVRVSAMDNSTADSSDATFLITTAPSLTLTMPNGGEQWAIGETAEIGWISEKITQKVNIELSRDNGDTWELLTTHSAVSDTIDHIVDGPATNNALVRIITEDGAIADTSNAVFSIYMPKDITLTSPNGGEQWLVGTTQKITWDSYQASTAVKLELTRDGGDTWDVITDSTENSGQYEWYVSLPASDKCLVQIYLGVSGTPADSSDTFFTILHADLPSITVTAPNGGEEWIVGSTQNITWTSANLEGDVKIELSRNSGGDWQTLSPSTANDGQFEWTVTEPISDTALIRISSIDTPASDQSDDIFSISLAPSLTITAPNGGEVWPIGTSKTISWKSENTSGTVKIELSRNNGATWETLTDSTKDDGDFTWTVTGPTSENCLVMVSDTDGSAYDVSDAFFKIDEPLSITVLSPNGGDVWQVGTEQEISWTAKNIVDSLEIQLSRDNGSTWEQLAIKDSYDESWMWTVTAPTSESCLIRIYAPHYNLSDESDAVFKIDIADGVARISDEIPTDYALEQNYPNPFNPVTRIQYQLPDRSQVRLEIYNALGNKIATLVNNTQSAGAYMVIWNGKDEHGNQMSSGIYFYRISADGFNQTRRMMLMK